MAPSSTLSKLALICLASSVVPSASALTVAISAAQALGVLQGRQTSTCPDSTFSRCPDTKLPSDFCCPAESTCISLDSSSSALCCPKGADCSKIQPVSCDLSFQDVSGVPDASIKTTRLKDKPASCGTNTCCPFGYSCDDKSQCIIDKATSSTGSSSTSSSASSTSTSSASSSASPVGIDSTEPAPLGSTPLCPRFPGAAVAVGFFPGMLAGALMALIGIICLGRRHPHDERPYSKGSSWSSTKYSNSLHRGRTATGTITGISEPIPMTQGGARTDFLRRPPSVMLRTGAHRAKSWFGSKTSPTFGLDHNDKVSPLNPVNHWKMPTAPNPNNVPLTTFGKTAPITPPSQIRPSAASLAREPSTESIKVYSPPSMVRPPSKSGFSPPSQQHSLKHSIMEKLSPRFKGTELKPKHPALASPPLNANHSYESVSRGGGALDPAPLHPHPHPAYMATTLPQPSPSPSFPLPTNSEKNNDYNPQPPQPTYYQTPHINQTNHSNPTTNSHPYPPASMSSPAPPDHSRPLTHMTTFTDVLRDAGLESQSDAAPAVPAMPKGLDWRGAKKTKGKSPGKREKERERGGSGGGSGSGSGRKHGGSGSGSGGSGGRGRKAEYI